MSEDNELQEIFFTEANELIEQFEQDVLSLENNSNDKELINRIFRAIHSIKGSASFVGFIGISELAHRMENLLELVRKGEVDINSDLTNILLRGLDGLKKMIEDPVSDIINEDQEVIDIVKILNKYLPGYVAEIPKLVDKEKTYQLKLNFNQNIFETGVDPLILISELENLGHVLECNVNTSKLPEIYTVDPFLVYLSWTIILKSEKSKEEIEDIFVFVLEDNDITIKETNEAEIENDKDKKFGEMLVEKGIISEEDLEVSLSTQQKIGEILANSGKLMDTQVEKIVQEQQQIRNKKEASSIRVDTQKLDKLMNLVGELVINQARISQITSNKDNINIFDLTTTSESLERITKNIQEQIMKARMIPIENTFNQFIRMVRDLSLKDNKSIRLDIKGKETELDKTLIELIGDPLKHMIRNSVDHGIESAQERVENNKDEFATITLNAYHEAGNIVIEVSDDGRGLNKDKILQKAIEKGLVPANKELIEDEIYKLIFLPGFSTAENVTEISGRGVGMDVVQSNIKKLRGNVEIYSKKDVGTTFRVILPLTLAIIDGMLVKVGEELFVIPILSIVESLRPKVVEIKNVNSESQVVNVRGDYIPLIRLYEMFGIETERKDPSKALIVIVSMGKNKACILVDDILGQQQAVIKSLEENFKSIEGISGATILGDGTLAMILDVATIVKHASNI